MSRVKSKFLQNLFANPKPLRLGDITLIPLEQKHLDFYHQLYSSAETVRYQRIYRCADKKQSLIQLRSRLIHWKKGKEAYYIVKQKNITVGGFSINRINYSQRFFSIGFVILKKFWGQEIATKLVERFVKYAILDLKLEMIKANCMAGNKAVQKVLTKASFKQVYTRRKGAKIKGKWHDVYYYHLQKTEIK